MNKLKGIILVVSICFASIMMPFNIYADSLPQSEIVGVSWNLIDTEISLSSGGNWYTYTYELEVKLKNKYVGIVDGTLSYTYSSVQNTSSTPTSRTDTTTKRNYVNGDSFKFNVYISNIGQQFTGNGPMYNCSYLINNSSTNVTKYEDLNSIESVVNVLNDIYQNSTDIEGLSNNQLTELEKIVSNTSLANEYLDTLTKLKQWNVPIESYLYVIPFLNNYEVKSFVNIYDLSYPFFDIPSNSTLFQLWTDPNYTFQFIFITNQNLQNSTLLNQFEITNLDTYELDNSLTPSASLFGGARIFKIKVKFKTYNNGLIKYIGSSNALFCPIYVARKEIENISTDFALKLGLNNQLLNDLHIIANGNSASNSASQQLDSDTSDFNTDRDDLIDIEDSMGDSMDSAMNQITPNNNGLSGFGGNFLTSAVWVRTQFEQLTNNTPYGSLIVYGMTLGLALLLLGKVML